MSDEARPWSWELRRGEHVLEQGDSYASREGAITAVRATYQRLTNRIGVRALLSHRTIEGENTLTGPEPVPIATLRL